MKECPRCQTCFDDPLANCPRDGSPLEELLAGSRLIDGKYQIECLLGRGGMGAVYQVRHLGLEKRFALKLILPSKAIRERFLAEFRLEAKVLGRLKHDNIVEVTDYGLDDRNGGTPYLVMEFLEGSILKARIQESGPLSLESALPLLEQMARAIDYAHQKGVLHCDVKPANVFLQQSPGHPPIAKILDFGLAMLLRTPESDRNYPDNAETPSDWLPIPCGRGQESSADSTQSSISDSSRETADAGASQPAGIRGTLAYMAPEIISGERPASAADIYAFGVLIYEMLAGRLPFTGTSNEIAHGHLNLPVPRPSARGVAIPAEVESALLRPLEKAARNRPRNAWDSVSAIRSASCLAEKRIWRAREMPRRLALAALLAPILALLSIAAAGIGPLQRSEGWTIDARFLVKPRKPPDPRILIVSVDDATLAADQTLIGDRADEFSRQLERVFAAGARGIAIDFLLPRSWSRSAAFSQFVLKHTDDITLAAFSTPRGETVGTECLAGLTAAALGPVHLGSLFGFVNLDEDTDGITRRARLFYGGRAGEKLDTWAAHSARTLIRSPFPAQTNKPGSEIFWVDYSIDWQQFDTISWMDLSRRLDADPSIFEGRLVLLGGDFVASGDDFHRIPALGGMQPGISGVVLEALIVNTILSGTPIRQLQTPWRILFLSMTCLILVGAVLCLARLPVIACVFCGVGLSGVTIAFAFFRWAGAIMPIVGLLLAGLLALASGVLMRLRLAAFPSEGTEI
jgi:serine/threonine protein kinase/CHASE2 domain-containing sensor protein